MSLLTAPVVKDSHIFGEIYFIFLKNVLKQTWKAFKGNLELIKKIGKTVSKKGKIRNIV